MEARVGIEPTNEAFAEPCLTTWLPRHSQRRDDSRINWPCKRNFPHFSYANCAVDFPGCGEVATRNHALCQK